jgi:hypothetical protein
MLSYWLKQPQAKAFREMLPELGVNGGLATACKDCPAKGKLFAKPGTDSLPDYVNEPLVDNESLGGTWRQSPVTSTSSAWWSTARRRKTYMMSSRSSTTSRTSRP